MIPVRWKMTQISAVVLARYSYKNTEQPVDSWIDMFERVVKTLHDEDETVLTAIAHTNDAENDLSLYISSNPQNLRSPLKIDEKSLLNEVQVRPQNINTAQALKLQLKHR